MSYRASPSATDRFKAISGVVLVYTIMAAALLLVRTSAPTRTSGDVPPVLIDITEPPPPSLPEPDLGKAKEEEGASGKKAEPTEIIAPKPPIQVPAEPPVAAAPIAGTGSASTSGAVTTGTGPGAGGSGTGRGGGGSGSGAPAQWLAGGLQDSDYPRAALRSGLQGRVSVRFTVLTNGRIANCRVVASSGSPLLDATTCRLLTERLRFRPARNGAGAPIEAELGSDYTWGIRFRR